LWANLEVYADLARRSRAAARWQDKLLVWFKPPGWQPALAGVAAGTKPAFDLASVRTYDPPMTPAARRFALLQLGLCITAAVPLLWFSDSLPTVLLVCGSLGILALLWLNGAVMQGRLGVRSAVTVAAVIALAVALAFAAGTPRP
jgi:hypothetical protein